MSGTAGFCLPTGCLILNRCTCRLVPSGLGILPGPAISPVWVFFEPSLSNCPVPDRVYICVRACRLRSSRSCIIMVVSAAPPAHHFTRMPASDIDPSPTSFHPLSLAETHTHGRAVCIFSLLDPRSIGIKAVALLARLSFRPGSLGSGGPAGRW